MQTKKAKLIPKNKILSVTVKRVVDDSPDTSWLGEYSNHIDSDYSIDRAHSLDCVVNSVKPSDDTECGNCTATFGEHNNFSLACPTKDSDQDWCEDSSFDPQCDCGERGDMGRNELRYFNPCYQNYKGLPADEIRKYCRQDYDRMESLNRGDWCFIGISAEAVILLPQKDGSGAYQVFHSGGLYGIESDSERSYIESEQKNQLAELRDVLRSFGFSSRAISQAFKSIERKES